MLLLLVLVVIHPESVAGVLKVYDTHAAQVVEHIFVNELILTYALDHEVALFAESPNDTKNRDPWDIIYILRTRLSYI